MRLTAKQAPHRPGISSALGLHAGGDDFLIVPQTRNGRHAHDKVSIRLSHYLAVGAVTCVISPLAWATPNAGSLVGWGDNIYGDLTCRLVTTSWPSPRVGTTVWR